MSSSDPKSRPAPVRKIPFAGLVSRVAKPHDGEPESGVTAIVPDIDQVKPSPASSVYAGDTIAGTAPIATKARDAESGVRSGPSETEPAPSAPVSGSSYVGVTIDGRYRVEALLGEGGMGVVYLARHKVIGKKVAIKILRSDLVHDKATTERFLQEAKAASSIGNPHIIDISDFGELPDGSTYLVMEWLDGKSLTNVLEETHPLPVVRAVDVAKQVAVALAAAHAQGIVHRDLKPDNIFLIRHGDEPDFVKILDFGVAKVATAGAKLTRAGSVVGTPLYMSPEQAAGSPVDARTDVYALGVILYEMVSGRVPFDAENIVGILTQHMVKPPTPFRQLDPPPAGVDEGLEAVVLKALSKKPEQRYQTMEALAEDLDAVSRNAIPNAVSELMARSAGFTVPEDFFKKMARPASAPDVALGMPKSRRKLYVGVGAVLVLAAVGAMALTSAKSAKDEPAPVTLTTPQAAVAPPVDPTPAAEPKRVLLAAEPIDAHFFTLGQDLGSAPLAVSVKEGEHLTLEVRRDGFKSQTLTVDGSQKTVTVRLVKLPSARPPPPKGREVPRALRPPSIGGSEIVNPWAK